MLRNNFFVHSFDFEHISSSLRHMFMEFISTYNAWTQYTCWNICFFVISSTFNEFIVHGEAHGRENQAVSLNLYGAINSTIHLGKHHLQPLVFLPKQVWIANYPIIILSLKIVDFMDYEVDSIRSININGCSIIWQNHDSDNLGFLGQQKSFLQISISSTFFSYLATIGL
jgi:hypothetical protein